MMEHVEGSTELEQLVAGPGVTGPCIVEFISFPLPSGTIHLHIHLGDGEYHAAISAIRENGGVYTKDGSGADFFLPWPPAAIRIVKESKD